MNKQPSVSIIIPYKDNLNFLFSALNSVFRQTYRNFKIVIIYDNENKADLSKINKFLQINKRKKLPSISIEVNKINLGAGYSRNKGIKKSKTKYVAFLDSDDLWVKDKLKIQINHMEKNNYVFSHTSYYVINDKDKVTSIRNARSNITFDELLRSCDIGLSTVILNTKFIKKNKYYFPKIKTKEDFVLWLRIIKNLKSISGLNRKLTYYRKTSNSLSSDKFTSLVNGYKVYRNYMNFSKSKSLYYLIILSINFLIKYLFKSKN